MIHGLLRIIVYLLVKSKNSLLIYFERLLQVFFEVHTSTAYVHFGGIAHLVRARSLTSQPTDSREGETYFGQDKMNCLDHFSVEDLRLLSNIEKKLPFIWLILETLLQNFDTFWKTVFEQP